jgi:uncharacterized damage-inducible protein DinB
MTTQALIDQYAGGAQQLRQAVAGMSGGQLRARPVAGKWSTLEVVCHIADFEPVYADRMKRVLAEENPLILAGDPDQFAAKLAYDARDLEEELALIDVVRRQMVRILRGLSASDFARTGRHTEAGPMSLETLLTRVTNHLPHHIKFIQEKRQALGV